LSTAPGPLPMYIPPQPLGPAFADAPGPARARAPGPNPPHRLLRPMPRCRVPSAPRARLGAPPLKTKDERVHMRARLRVARRARTPSASPGLSPPLRGARHVASRACAMWRARAPAEAQPPASQFGRRRRRRHVGAQHESSSMTPWLPPRRLPRDERRPRMHHFDAARAEALSLCDQFALVLAAHPQSLVLAPLAPCPAPPGCDAQPCRLPRARGDGLPATFEPHTLFCTGAAHAPRAALFSQPLSIRLFYAQPFQL
jgi:hypothetical protein